MAVLADKVAVITGGTSGIGTTTVETFVREGARVVFTGRQVAKGTALADRLGDAALFLPGDVSSETHVKEAVDLAITSFGRLDCFFNNAGAPGAAGPIASIAVADFDATVAVLFRGVFLGMKHAAPVMIEQGCGVIITNASVAGLRTGYGPHIYSATKAAVIHLTRSVAMELGEHGVRVNCICPGAIATPIFGRSLGLSNQQADETLDRLEDRFAAMQPIPRAGQPQDIADAALWLASDQSTFVNGEALVVDGGLIGGVGYSAAQQGFSDMVAALRQD